MAVTSSLYLFDASSHTSKANSKQSCGCLAPLTKLSIPVRQFVYVVAGQSIPLMFHMTCKKLVPKGGHFGG